MMRGVSGGQRKRVTTGQPLTYANRPLGFPCVCVLQPPCKAVGRNCLCLALLALDMWNWQVSAQTNLTGHAFCT